MLCNLFCLSELNTTSKWLCDSEFTQEHPPYLRWLVWKLKKESQSDFAVELDIPLFYFIFKCIDCHKSFNLTFRLWEFKAYYECVYRQHHGYGRWWKFLFELDKYDAKLKSFSHKIPAILIFRLNLKSKRFRIDCENSGVWSMQVFNCG